MLDNDTFTYSYQKNPTHAVKSRLSERALITADRSQKLDLLTHLLTNLQQSLIVCGPAGIGKTTLIQTLEECQKEIWPICILQGSSALSFESVVTQLSRFLNLSNANVRFDLSSLRAFCEKQKVILIIDDAEDLVPGLIGEIMDFADSLAGLRLVLSMNNDTLQAKITTDSAIDNCHVIEIPPLSQRQCLEYLQNLSAQPDTQLSFNAITDALVENLYQETQGIPGKLLAQLPKLNQFQTGQSRRYGLWIGVIAIIAAAGFAAKSMLPPTVLAELFSQPTIKPATTPTQPIAEVKDTETNRLPPASDFVSAPFLTEATPIPAVITPAITEASINNTVQEGLAEPDAVDQATADEVAAIEQPTAEIDTLKPESSTAEAQLPIPEVKPAPPAPIKTTSSDDDLEWIMAQPGKNYTVQIMTLSNKTSAIRFIKRNAAYSDSLKYYAIGKSGQERYVIIYGSFLSAIDAMKQKSTMPNDFNNGLIKRFNVVQKQSRRPAQ
jgi:DamX protein